jgi:hypothetical protein
MSINSIKKKINVMIKAMFLTMAVSVILFSSCSKESNCSTTYDILTSKEWIPTQDPDIFAKMLFSTDGYYYENSKKQGQWELEDDCKTIKFIGNTLKFEISEIKSDKLVISGPLGSVTYK